MDIYTAHYTYSGEDRMDITVKGNTFPGSVFAPKWEMVKALQAQKIDNWEYTLQYMGLMAERWFHTPDATNMAIQTMTENRTSLTLVCFCKPQTFCHRILAARLLESMGHGKYHGERLT